LHYFFSVIKIANATKLLREDVQTYMPSHFMIHTQQGNKLENLKDGNEGYY
jgi:hypothetical protein